MSFLTGRQDAEERLEGGKTSAEWESIFPSMKGVKPARAWSARGDNEPDPSTVGAAQSARELDAMSPTEKGRYFYRDSIGNMPDTRIGTRRQELDKGERQRLDSAPKPYEQNGRVVLVDTVTRQPVQNLPYASLRTAIHAGAIRDFSNVDLKGADFGELPGQIRGIDFSRSDLRGASFVNSNLSMCSFRSARLARNNFSGASLESAVFENCDLSMVKFRGANLSGTRFVNCKLPPAESFADTIGTPILENKED